MSGLRDKCFSCARRTQIDARNRWWAVHFLPLNRHLCFSRLRPLPGLLYLPLSGWSSILGYDSVWQAARKSRCYLRRCVGVFCCCLLQTVSICVAVSFGHSQYTWDPHPVWRVQRGRRRQQIKSNVRDESLSSWATRGGSPKSSPKFSRTLIPYCSCSCALSAYLLLHCSQCLAGVGVAGFEAFNFS